MLAGSVVACLLRPSDEVLRAEGPFILLGTVNSGDRQYEGVITGVSSEGIYQIPLSVGNIPVDLAGYSIVAQVTYENI